MYTLTDKAIVNATLELAREKPFNRITIKDITGRLGITRGTFYYHFKDIYDVLSKYITETFFLPLNKAKNINELFYLLKKAFINLNRNKNEYLRIFKTLGHEPFKVLMSRKLNESIGLLLKRLDTKHSLTEEDIILLSSFYEHAVSGVILDWIDNGKTYTEDQINEITDRISELFKGQIELILKNADKEA